MIGDSQTPKDDLITRSQYIRGRLGLLWRFPTIKKTIKKIENIFVEDRESWGSMLEETAAKFPDNAAIKSHDGNYSWKAYNDWTNRYANYFLSQGMKKGDAAVVFLENRPELLMAYSAMGKIGAANSMINTNLRQESLLHCLKLNPANVFIIGEEVLDAFEEVKDDLDLGEDQNIFYLKDKGQRAAPDGTPSSRGRWRASARGCCGRCRAPREMRRSSASPGPDDRRRRFSFRRDRCRD